MGNKIEDGDHVFLGPAINDEIRMASVVDGDGVMKPAIVTRRPGIGKSFKLEPCPTVPEGVFHAGVEGHKGPA
jgi:hypothetical protein